MRIKSIFAAACVCLTMAACAQNTPSEYKDLLPTKSQIDTVSYLLGIEFGSFIQGYDFGDDFNYAEITNGIKDMISAKGDPNDAEYMGQFKYSPDILNDVFNSFLEKRSKYKAALGAAEGQKFLDENKLRDGVAVTESGLQYKIIEKGTGSAPTIEDQVEVKYAGTLIDGTEFDSSNGETITLPLSGVIAGWSEGIQLINEGGKIQLFIPSDLAYGESGSGPIGPNSVLIFDVELVKVIKAEEAE